MAQPPSGLHLGDFRDCLRDVNPYVHLTITSPPYYDDFLYDEFGWHSEKDYWEDMRESLATIHDITLPGGIACIIVSATRRTADERDGLDAVLNKKDPRRWEIPHRMLVEARKIGWRFLEDVTWAVGPVTDCYESHPLSFESQPIGANGHSSSDTTAHTTNWEGLEDIHHHIIVLGTEGERDEPIHSTYPGKLQSVWVIPEEHILPEYNLVYGSFPPELVRRCTLLWSNVGDMIMDPFAGSCVVGKVARNLNRRFVCIEIDPHYHHLGTKYLQS